LDIVLHFLRKSFQFLQVGLYGVRKIVEFKREKVGIRQSHDGRAAGLRERAFVNKFGVTEVREPVEIIVDGMIDTALVFTAEPDVQRGDAIMLQESGVVRTRAERR